MWCVGTEYEIVTQFFEYSKLKAFGKLVAWLLHTSVLMLIVCVILLGCAEFQMHGGSVLL